LPKTEAEFITASEGAKELLWLKRMLGELGAKGRVVPTLYHSFVTKASQLKMCDFFQERHLKVLKCYNFH